MRAAAVEVAVDVADRAVAAPDRDEDALPVGAAVAGAGVGDGGGREHQGQQVLVAGLIEQARGEAPSSGPDGR